jgi:choline dehydrogenase-like flavoprotein
MISDLATQGDAIQSVKADVAIVGAGVAGLVLAERLRRRKIRTIVLESGGLSQASDSHPLNSVVQLGDNYAGATQGRFRCLGGTSTRWGGALLPFQPSDLLERAYVDLPAFPVSAAELGSYLADAEALFGLDRSSYEEDFVRAIGAERYIPVGDEDFHVRFAKWPPFKKRNVATLFEGPLKNDGGLLVMLNATVTRITAEDGKVRSIQARHIGGKSVEVKADHFVICAGAIESTRLLLLFNRQHDNRLFENNKALGHYFFDHISTKMADIRPVDLVRLNRMAGFRFVGGAMRSLRFELSASVQQNEKIGSAHAHISFRTSRHGAFEALRQLMRGRQRGAPLTSDMFLAPLRDLPYLARLSFWRLIHRQLLWPSTAAQEVHVVIEQLPRVSNSIGLAQEMDMFGQPLAAINWRVSDEDRKAFAVFRRRFEAFWRRRELARIAELSWFGTGSDGPGPDDVFHPGGTTRMGADRRSAVINSDLRLFGVPNLWAASTAAFPSGGGANPTLTLILLTMRLADHLALLSERSRASQSGAYSACCGSS